MVRLTDADCDPLPGVMKTLQGSAQHVRRAPRLLKDTRVAHAAPTPHARRVDADYERAGTARVGIAAEPWQGWRPVRVRPQRTQVDWA